MPKLNVVDLELSPEQKQKLLLQAAKNALADLEGIMPEHEPSGDREHPAWQTIEELIVAIEENSYYRLVPCLIKPECYTFRFFRIIVWN